MTRIITRHSNRKLYDPTAKRYVSLADIVDLVVSGINPNANIGHDVTYSGTVTAAMEAVIDGGPGIAVSLDSKPGHGELDYGPAAQVAAQVAANHRGVRVRSPNRRRWLRAGTVVRSAREGRCRGSRRYRL